MNIHSGIELKLIKEFPCEIIAVDEVGRAPLAGAVVVGAVRVLIQDQDSLKKLLKFLKPKGVTDSKKLTHEVRQKILKKLKVPDLNYRETGILDFKGIEVSFVTWEMCHVTIDKENILAASLRAMKEAAMHLSNPQNLQTHILIDGICKLRWGKGVESPWNEITIIKGDSKSLLIGLASIIAKEKRDAFMKDMHELYPYYGFNTNFGYPTPAHRKAIREYGPCPIHRRTFAGVKGVKGKKIGVKRVKKIPSITIPAASDIAPTPAIAESGTN
jgi:ribonuclease HII